MEDYREIGLKVGIEIHQRLGTKTKLFCACPADFEDQEELFVFARRLRPTASEIGKVDRAAMEEFSKEKEFVYHSYPNCCSIETDSDFPREINPEALEIALQLAKMLKMQVPDVLQVMRKIVIDGSNTTGYQRTALVGVGTIDSFIETSFGPVHLQEMQLEEESATKIKEEAGVVHYRLDRLGIPLVELSSAPEIWHPKQAKEFAENLGLILRSLKVQRGIGTIRQDINISVKGGARIEVKGFQDVKVLDKVVENEVKRQRDLIAISEKLKGKDIEFTQKDLTSRFSNSGSKLLRSLSREKVLGLRVGGLGGFFREKCGELTLGKEIANYVKVFGIGGIVHSDEDLPKYGFEPEEVPGIKKELGFNECDLFILIGGKSSPEALELLKERITYLRQGVPEETRFVDAENTRYARKLPGSARMYPEPDLPKVALKELYEKAKPPESLDEKAARFEKLGLGREMALQISRSKDVSSFEYFVENYEVEPKVIADIMTCKRKSVERQGVSVDEEKLCFVLEALDRKRISKKAVEEVLLSGKIEGFERISGKDLEALVETFKADFGPDAAKELMKLYGKRVESEEVFGLLKQ
ncbi:MAG: Glu-tRNA(Gln) amidotransferase subunit GatE [Candidatus Aenigmarchaeota archaeon]|nr:Glu-tRNA(Gln) amidotransferase subunit GatE [Candidatus Aenigmarchaeota archaeon]